MRRGVNRRALRKRAFITEKRYIQREGSRTIRKRLSESFETIQLYSDYINVETTRNESLEISLAVSRGEFIDLLDGDMAKYMGHELFQVLVFEDNGLEYHEDNIELSLRGLGRDATIITYQIGYDYETDMSAIEDFTQVFYLDDSRTLPQVLADDGVAVLKRY